MAVPVARQGIGRDCTHDAITARPVTSRYSFAGHQAHYSLHDGVCGLPYGQTASLHKSIDPLASKVPEAAIHSLEVAESFSILTECCCNVKAWLKELLVLLPGRQDKGVCRDLCE